MIAFRLATKARACGFHVNRKVETINKLPFAGSVASIEVEDNGGTRHTATRVAAGVVGGAVFLPLALVGFTKKDRRKIHVTITTADGRKATRVIQGSHQQVAIDFVNDFNNVEVTV